MVRALCALWGRFLFAPGQGSPAPEDYSAKCGSPLCKIVHDLSGSQRSSHKWHAASEIFFQVLGTRAARSWQLHSPSFWKFLSRFFWRYTSLDLLWANPLSGSNVSFLSKGKVEAKDLAQAEDQVDELRHQSRHDLEEPTPTWNPQKSSPKK